jgi:enterochelin esterase-like enzyme
MLLLLPFLAAVHFAAAGDSVVYPSLANRGLSDCLPVGLLARDSGAMPVAGPTPASAICRVRRAYAADTVRAHLATGERVWREGDELTFAWRGVADAVELSGGVGFPMAHLAGTDLWVLTARADSLDRAVIGYMFFASSTAGSPATPAPAAYWRGPRAPAEPLHSAVLHGRLVRDTVASTALGTPRALTVYVPPPRGAEPIAHVVYMADGQSLAPYAAILDTLIVTRQLPRILVVGLHSDPSPIKPIPGRPGEYEADGRSREYLPSVDSVRFAAHERLLLDEVLPYAERTYGAPTGAARRLTFGFSNGAAFAGAMGLSHPDLFGAVIAFSPGGGAKAFAAIPQSATRGRTGAAGLRLYVSGGLYETGFRANARVLAELFQRTGAQVVLREPAGGHDEAIWQREFADAVRWALASHPPNTR